MNKPSPHYAAISLIVAICLSIFAISAYLMIQGRRGVAFAAVGASFSLIAWFRNRKEVSPLCLLPAFLLVIFYTCRAFLLDKAGPSGMLPTYDIFALFVDGKFGFQPSIWVRQVICRSHFGELVLQNTYEGLPAVLGLAYALNIGAQNRHWRVFGLFLLTAIVGTQCYRLLPICGPAYLPFGDECFYFHGSCSTDAMLSGAPYMIDVDSRFPRNGMPSLHMAWALMVWWVCFNRKSTRLVGLGFVLLTALATLAFGEHYLVDLAAAFPFSAALWFVCMDRTPLSGARRVMPIVIGVAGYLAWIVCIRVSPGVFGYSLLVPWAAAIASWTWSVVVVLSTEDESQIVESGRSGYRRHTAYAQHTDHCAD